MSDETFEKNLHLVSGFQGVPEKWIPASVRDICTLGRGRVISQEEIDHHPGVYPVYSSQTMNNGEMGRMDSFDFEGDLITWTTDGANAGTIFYRSGRFNCTNVCGTLSPRTPGEVDLRFLCYHLGRIAKKYVSYIGNPKLMNDVMARVAFVLPPLPQQRKIARILTTVDNLIEKTEALIAKYQAIKQGMMHDLFTRGVDEHGHLRPPYEQAPELYKQSELGWIPKEWEVRPLGEIAAVGGGVTLGRDLAGSQVVDLPYLRVANVQDGYLDLSEIKTISVMKSEVDRYKLEYGDMLMTEGGDFDKLGRGTVWRGQISTCLHQNHIFRVRPSKEFILPDFLAAVTASSHGKRYFLISSKQTTNLATINSTQLKAFPIPLPNLDEQDRMIAAIASVERQIQEEQRYSNQMKKAKTGLMQDLLTGKVRVQTNGAEEFAG